MYNTIGKHTREQVPITEYLNYEEDHTQSDTIKMLQDWIDELNRQEHDLAVSYIKSHSDLLDTDMEEFVRNCPPSCKLKVEEMLLKAGIEFPDMSLKKWHMLLYDYAKTYNIDYQKSFDDYISYTLSNKSDWTVTNTGLVQEETL